MINTADIIFCKGGDCPEELSVDKAIKNTSVTDPYALQTLSLTLANLYAAIDKKEEAKQMCGHVINGEDGALKKLGYVLRDTP